MTNWWLVLATSLLASFIPFCTGREYDSTDEKSDEQQVDQNNERRLSVDDKLSAIETREELRRNFDDPASSQSPKERRRLSKLREKRIYTQLQLQERLLVKLADQLCEIAQKFQQVQAPLTCWKFIRQSKQSYDNCMKSGDIAIRKLCNAKRVLKM